jgi:C_GCAxxG_C_C family probable redox protein
MILAPEKTLTKEEKKIIADDAVYNFVHGSLNCSESICVAYNNAKGFPEDHNRGLFSPFAGGIAGRGEMCGAVSAALMIRSQEAFENGASKSEIRTMAKQMTEDFQNEFGTLQCAVLSRHDCEDGTEFDLNHCGKFISFLIEK